METITEITRVRDAIRTAKAAGKAITFVPTMGALHHGHRTLIKSAKADPRAYCVVSIFVNPTQFGPQEDLDQYPRPLETDLEACRADGVQLVFTPRVEDMYPTDAATTVHVAGVTEHLCGPFRPGHFDGVATVVTKLFSIVQPDRAYFGEKDFQQLQVIRRLVSDLNVPLEIVGCPTVREADGLALSSRNRYLSTAARVQAGAVPRALAEVQARFDAGLRDAAALERAATEVLTDAGIERIDYVTVVDALHVQPIAQVDRDAVLAIAVHVGTTRLIDNCRLTPPDPARGR